ncbi:MAG: deoxycytidine triphosphate deaminase [Proteobacteria bacterium]|nr:MAG: deoxycytidine triphosphate deaminase [Pseudomonadota bacterium]
MSFWSTQKLSERIKSEDLISPFAEDAIKSAAYELSLGEECFLTSDPDNTKDKLDNHDQVSIPPGQFGLLISEESVKVPLDAIAFISIKAGVKFRGLVNVSGFHVDPGFMGKLKFSVFNAGGQPIVIQRNQRIFLIWYADLDQKTEAAYSGAHQNQSQISGEDVMRIQGEIASPAVLAKRISDLETQFKVWSGVLLTVLLAIFAMSLRNCSEAGAAHAKTGASNSEYRAPVGKDLDKQGADDSKDNIKPDKPPTNDSGSGSMKTQTTQ